MPFAFNLGREQSVPIPGGPPARGIANEREDEAERWKQRKQKRLDCWTDAWCWT